MSYREMKLSYRDAFRIMSNECRWFVQLPGFKKGQLIDSKRDMEAIRVFLAREQIDIEVEEMPYSEMEVDAAKHKMFVPISIVTVTLILASAQLYNVFENYD